MIKVDIYGEVYDDFESDFWFEDLLDKEEMKLDEENLLNKGTIKKMAEDYKQCNQEQRQAKGIE